jgi:predicted RNA binding protein YcfA (HicA-like mRNA interferase family)
MVSEQPTRTILNELTRTGWAKKRDAKGSHTFWQCTSGRHTVTVPSGHRTIRPGVVRVIRQAIINCDCRKEN